MLRAVFVRIKSEIEIAIRGQTFRNIDLKDSCTYCTLFYGNLTTIENDPKCT